MLSVATASKKINSGQKFILMEKILHEEQSFSADDGWVLVSKNELNEVWRKKDPDHPTDLIKVCSYTVGHT